MPILTPPSRRQTPLDPTVRVPRLAHESVNDAWKLLGWVGIGFSVLGLMDISLGWYPAAFGNIEWEFGTISGSLNALAIPMLGLYLVLASAIARSDQVAARVVSIIMGLLLLTVLVLGVIYLTAIPIALKAVESSPLVTLGIKKAVAKALLLGTGDSILLAAGMVRGWRVKAGS